MRGAAGASAPPPPLYMSVVLRWLSRLAVWLSATVPGYHVSGSRAVSGRVVCDHFQRRTHVRMFSAKILE